MTALPQPSTRAAAPTAHRRVNRLLSITRSMTADDFRVLEHTGLVSVQLQKPGSQTPSGEVPSNDDL